MVASPRRASAGSKLEDALAAQIKAAGLPEPTREASLIPGRKFRHDLYWKAYNLAVEIQGQIWSKGGHTSGSGYLKDCRKMQLTALQGVQTIYVTAECIRSGRALAWIEALLRSTGAL